jgi:hypothetical protein
MTSRRFNENEIAAIFELATEAQQANQRLLPSGEGMTLGELQEIGRDVGIPPELIARAALALDQQERSRSQQFLGLPVGVSRTVDLQRPLSQDEWERLVVDLRETFDARGTVRQEGSLRQWSNGNLQALLEPAPSGYRLRLRTVKSEARSLLVAGLTMFGLGSAGLSAATLGAATGDTGMVAALGSLTLAGLAVFGANAFRLPRWAQLRQRQMDEIAARVASATAPPLLQGTPPGAPQDD